MKDGDDRERERIGAGPAPAGSLIQVGSLGEHARNVLHRQLSGKWRKSVESYGHLAAFTPARAQSSSGAGM
jgi:hypothetical protein